jgi:hypothetical protein
LLSLDNRAPSITLEKKAPSRAQHSHRRKPSPTRRVRSVEDRIQPFITITPSEATKGSGAPDEILTYMYIKPQVHWFPNEEDPMTDPFRIVQGLGGYAHRARSRAPSDKEIRPSLTRPQPLPRAQGLPRTLGSRSTAPLGPTLDSCPANDASQGLGIRRQALGYRCPGAPLHRSQGMPCQLLL